MNGEGARPGVGFGTAAVHAGAAGNVTQQPTSVPVFQTATWRFDTTEQYAAVASGAAPGYLYTRGHGNPTVEAFEVAMAALEGSEAAVALSSGMAALTAVLEIELTPGSRVIADTSLYGGTRMLLQRFRDQGRCELVAVDVNDDHALGAVLPDATMLLAETVSNWDGKVVDLPAVLDRCRPADVTTVIDGTFATPYLCAATPLGADYVVHSASKYIGGHGDLIAGIVCTGSARADRVRHEVALTGASAAPLDAWLALRGLMTLGLRMERISDTAGAVAAFLATDDRACNVRFAGLPGDRWHETACRVLRRPGGLIAFDHADGFKGASRFCSMVEVAWLAGSLGGPQTLVAHPASTAAKHPNMRALALPEATVKIAVGLEDAPDLIADFDQALGTRRRRTIPEEVSRAEATDIRTAQGV